MNFAIVAAGGKGRRFQSSTPKQLLLLKGRAVLSWTMRRFQRETRIDRILLVYPQAEPEMEQRYREILDQEKVTKGVLVCGGEERVHSVQNAFNSIESASDSDLVLIHDAARPLLSQSLLRSLLDAGVENQSVVPVLPLVETLKSVENHHIVRTVPRQNLFLAQTPQVFHYGILKSAYAAVALSPEITDEAILVEKAGFKVSVIEGERRNIKITEPTDLKLAEYFLDQGEE